MLCAHILHKDVAHAKAATKQTNELPLLSKIANLVSINQAESLTHFCICRLIYFIVTKCSTDEISNIHYLI